MKDDKIRFKTAFIKDNYIWCVPSGYNVCVKISISDWNVELVCDFSNINGKQLYFEYIFNCNDKIYFSAKYGANVLCYNKKNGQIKYFYEKTGYRENIGTVFYKDRLWIIPRNISDELVTFDLQNKTFSEKADWCVAASHNNISNGYIMKICAEKRGFFMVLKNTKNLVYYDFDKQNTECYELDSEHAFFSLVNTVGDVFIILEDKYEIIKWNKLDFSMEKYSCPYPKKEKHYINALAVENYIFLMDKLSVDIFSIKDNIFIQDDTLNSTIENKAKTGSLFFNYIRYNDFFFFLPWNAENLIVLNKNLQVHLSKRLKLPKMFYFNEILKGKEVPENAVQLNEYLSYISSLTVTDNQNFKEKNSNGKKILDIVI